LAGISASATINQNSSGFGLSRHYPVGSHPTAFANGFITAIETPLRRCGVSPVNGSYHNLGTVKWPGAAAEFAIMNDESILIGTHEILGETVPSGISLPDLRQHVYVIVKLWSNFYSTTAGSFIEIPL
jgi:hypothetical protein